MTTALNDILLRRRRAIFIARQDGGSDFVTRRGPALGDAARRLRSERSFTDAEVLRALEAALAQLGYLMSAEVRATLAAISRTELVSLARHTLIVLATDRGANVAHVPQFRKFPSGTPQDTDRLYIERVLRWLFQDDGAPCLVCGNDAVHAVAPCGHLVCGECFDGSNYSGCPICHGRIDPSSPFLRPAPTRGELPTEHAQRPVRLGLGHDVTTEALSLAGALLMRQSPLNPGERDDLLTITCELGPAVLDSVPHGGIPVRETQALVLGCLLDRSENPVATLEGFAPYLRTATDVLRVLNVWMGSDAGLVEPRPRLRPINRPLRRTILVLLERLPLDRLGEDMQRHRDHWIRAGEALRPFEYHRRFPNVALSFASLRRSLPDPESPLATTLRRAASAGPGEIEVSSVRTAQRVRLRSFAAQVEAALAAGSLDRAVQLLSQRPGDLARRFDDMLRRAILQRPELLPALLAALTEAAPKLPTPLLLTLRSALSVRHEPLSRRVFFPRGAVTRAFGVIDTRPTLPSHVIRQVTAILSFELARRAARLDPVSLAVIDEGLSDLLVPVAERTASKALVQLPRGSVVPLPDHHERLRLFLHWTQPAGIRIDLDLSVALFNDDWWMVGLCDYTRLRAFSPDAAVHSGDITSAPAPLGSSEFVDLDISKLRRDGVCHAAMIIFSYNDVSFELMEDAFAGFMGSRDQRGDVFDARAVVQRFDLSGDAKMCLPMLIDLRVGVMRWVDVKPGTGPGLHSILRHRWQLAHMCCDLHDSFSAGNRPTLFEVAALQAAGRTHDVQVRLRDGAVVRLRRATGESVEAFLARLHTAGDADNQRCDTVELGDAPAFAALVRGDLELPAGSTVYALHADKTPESSVTQIAAGDLSSQLRP